jgi:hypothetical protein
MLIITSFNAFTTSLLLLPLLLLREHLHNLINAHTLQSLQSNKSNTKSHGEDEETLIMDIEEVTFTFRLNL